MNKFKNKKGFTLIEMLVVIAIIAILVAIVVPTVTSATNKAKAATNAANLRTAAAQVEIAMLTNDVDTTKVSASGNTITVAAGSGADSKDIKIDVPAMKSVSGITGGDVKVQFLNSAVVVSYGDDGTVAAFAAKAG